MQRRRFLMAAPALVVGGAANAQHWRDPEQHFFQALLGDLGDELRRARDERKQGVLLVFEMEACPFCERMHRTALREREVQDFYAARFNAFKIDIKGSTTVTAFDGSTLTEAAFAAQQKVRATPTCVFYDLGGRELTRYLGAPNDRREFIALAEYVERGAYRQQPFAAYRRAQLPK